VVRGPDAAPPQIEEPVADHMTSPAFSRTTPTMSDCRSVSIRLFAAARERAGAETVSIEVPVDACVSDLRRGLGEAIPALQPLVPHLLFARGTVYVRDDDRIGAFDEFVAFPPVSGG